jgi:hypothetical protein
LVSGFWQEAVGLGLVLAGWTLPRLVAGARLSSAAALSLDAAPLAIVGLVLFVAGGRPVFAGTIAFALGAGLAFADRIVRDTLREPVVFSALSELPQIFTHPQLYLPFAGTGIVLSGAAASVLLPLALLPAEPTMVAPHPACALALAGLVVALLWRTGREPWLGGAARALRRLGPTGEPFADAANLGPVAMLIVHGIIARAERRARQARLAPHPVRGPAAARPIILVQCESFFDARRALPMLPRDFLAGYDAACESGIYGRLDVPAWGANTMRAEFAVLTGIAEAALGYDRFNPYHALARAPIASQVWRLRAAGYRTICLHPFDRRFFRRDLAIPALGFETFLGRETLGGSRKPPYASDPDLARHILRVLDAEGPRTFIFAITMGNHGPWLATHPLVAAPLEAWKGEGRTLAPVPQERELLCYLDGLRRSDEMLRILIAGLEERQSDALLGFYGDHLPSLPRAFAHFGFDDWRSDYAIWSRSGEGPLRRDLAAHELGRAVVDAALVRPTPLPFDAVVAETHDA